VPNLGAACFFFPFGFFFTCFFAASLAAFLFLALPVAFGGFVAACFATAAWGGLAAVFAFSSLRFRP
jgi:hypothetical protein